MSDLQDLIARNAVMAYNQGVERGETEERERIIKLLELEIARHFELGLEASAYYLEGLVELIKGEQK